MKRSPQAVLEACNQAGRDLLLDLESMATWLGNTHSYEQAKSLATLMASTTSVDVVAGLRDDDEGDDFSLLQVQGSVGVIPIRGSLVRNANFFSRMFGFTAYSDVRAALVEAANNDAVKEVLLQVDSGGGDARGVADTADFIRTFDRKMKPVTAFTDGNMYSAAYWLGSAARKVYGARDAGLGSIGILAVHMERSKQLAEDGVKVTVMRAGKFKALMNPFEPLTADAKEQMQASMDELYKTFVGQVAQFRGVSYAKADADMAQGREFTGAQAVEAGLSDGLRTLAEVHNALASKYAIDISGAVRQNPFRKSTGASSMPAGKLTEQEIAALASGLTPEAAAEAAAAAALAAVAADKPAPAADKPADTAPQATDLVAFLQTQVKSQTDQILALSIKVQGLEAAAAETGATQGALLDIARASIGKMQVALGGAAPDLSAMSAAAVLVEHARVCAVFKAKFVVGGVAVTAPEDKKTAEAASVAPLQTAKLAAVKFNQK